MDSINFTEHFTKDMGNIMIEGLYLPHTYFDPLGKLWATVRKKARTKYKVDVAGVFIYDNVKGIISCNFLLSYSNVKPEDIEKYTSSFENHFEEISKDFETVIECFVDDDAYNEYLMLAQKKRDGMAVSRGEFDRVFNIFLKELGIRQN